MSVNRTVKISGGILLGVAILSLAGPWLSPHGFASINLDDIFAAPSIGDMHLFGTDELGRDLFVRTTLGMRLTLLVALVASFVSLVIGVAYGAIAGFVGGKVDAAIYARPHFMDDGTLAVIMRDRLTHHNLQSNPHAAFLFMEEGPGYKGKRLFLTKVNEEQDTELLHSLRRRQYPSDKEEHKFLVFFKLDKELPLVGAGK